MISTTLITGASTSSATPTSSAAFFALDRFFLSLPFLFLLRFFSLTGLLVLGFFAFVAAEETTMGAPVSINTGF
jgi:hypothetical protein